MVTVIGTGRTETVENRRNCALSPFGQGVLPYYTSPALQTLSAGISISTWPSIPGLPPTGQRLRLTAGGAPNGGFKMTGPLPAGEYVASMLVNRQSGASSALGFALPGIRSLSPARTFTFNAWTYIEERFTIAASEAGAVLGWRSSIVDATASDFHITNMQVTPLGQQAADGELVVAGSHPASSPLSYTWAGSPDASASIEWLTRPVQVAPILVDGYEATREAKSVVHPVLNRTFPDVTLRAPGPRKGTLRMLFATEAEAIDAFAVLSVAQVFTINDPDVPGMAMRFVVAEGDLLIGLDDTTRAVWWVSVPFVEVAP